MDIHLVVTDDRGRIYEGDVTLVAGIRAGRSTRPAAKRAGNKTATTPKLDFAIADRAFAKQHIKGLNGPRKFALLVAKLSKGTVGKAISLSDVEAAWNRMTEPMGGKYNGAYPTRAKEDGWVDTPKKGHYALTPGWANALQR